MCEAIYHSVLYSQWGGLWPSEKKVANSLAFVLIRFDNIYHHLHKEKVGKNLVFLDFTNGEMLL